MPDAAGWLNISQKSRNRRIGMPFEYGVDLHRVNLIYLVTHNPGGLRALPDVACQGDRRLNIRLKSRNRRIEMSFEYVLELKKAHLYYLETHKARIASGWATGP